MYGIIYTLNALIIDDTMQSMFLDMVQHLCY